MIRPKWRTVAPGLARRIGLRRSAGPDYEARLEHFYSRIVGPGDVCVDVGAHIGRHTLPLARRVGPSGRVFAFEPLPGIREVLTDSLKASGLDGIVTLSEAALSDFTGRSTFVVAEDALEESGLRERTYNVPTTTKRIDVAVTTMDLALPPEIGALRYVKIDCEGAEWSVLRGAAGTIDRLRPFISFEFGEAAYGAYGTDPAEVHRFFAARDYVVLDILGRQLDESAFSTSSVRQELWDYVAVPSSSVSLAGRALKTRRLGAPRS
jgi:FkbM family methyltransferase